jgi:hypothetical protein
MAKWHYLSTLVGIAVSLSLEGQAAIDRVMAGDMKRHQYVHNGVIVGGESGKSFTLLDVRRLLSAKDKIERIFLDLGDERGQPLILKISYFQVGVEKDLSRVVIELSQMSASAVDAKKMSKVFLNSPYVKAATIQYDPIDASLSIQLNLKKKMMVEAFQLISPDKAGRIVVDLKEQG